jgi:membrane-bound ClpP family serine protease
MARRRSKMQEYKVGNEFEKQGRQKFKRLYFGIIGVVFVMFLILTLIKTINNPDYNLTVILICLFGLMLIMSPLVVVIYFLGVKMQKKFTTGFSILLDDDSIALKSKKFVNIIIYRKEINEIIESKSCLKVTSKKPKMKTILVPINLAGYGEIKRKLESWVDKSLQ